MSELNRFWAVFDGAGTFLKISLAISEYGAKFGASQEFLAKHPKDWERLPPLGFTCREVEVVPVDELDALRAENERLRSAGLELQRQVNSLIESCYYRTNAGKVHWFQGRHFGTSIADNTDSKAFLEAFAAIRHNAGIGNFNIGDAIGYEDEEKLKEQA